ncbi:twin-arginine translocation signal domain-containing protein, partial [Duganella callida]
MTSRRSLLKIGAAGALTLAAGGAVYRLAHPPGAHRFALEGGAQAVLDAV